MQSPHMQGSYGAAGKVLLLLLLLLAPPERKRAKNAHLADLSECGLRGTNHAFEVFQGPEILRIPRIAFFKEERTQMPKHPCPNHNHVRVLRAYENKCIHAHTIITFVFREHTIAHPCPNHNNARVPKHTITEHTINSATIPKPE